MLIIYSLFCLVAHLAAAATPTKTSDNPLNDYFPGAITGDVLVPWLKSVLQTEKIDPTKVLVASSICSDEINQDVFGLGAVFGKIFILGGLAGLPFTGQTGYGAFTHHAPTGGALVIFYAPHVGISKDNVVGTVERRGQDAASTACGAAVAAWSAAISGVIPTGPRSDQDYQERIVKEVVYASVSNITAAKDQMAKLPLVLYDDIRAKILQLVPLDGEFPVILIGGIQINFRPEAHDYFMMKNFEIVSGGKIRQLSIVAPDLPASPVPYIAGVAAVLVAISIAVGAAYIVKRSRAAAPPPAADAPSKA